MRVKKLKKKSKICKKITTPVHLISVRFSSLTIFLFFFFTQCFDLLSFISLSMSLRLIGEERTKATSRKEIENCVAKLKTMKISSSQLRRSS